MIRPILLFCFLSIAFFFFAERTFAVVPTPDHVVIVVLENHAYDTIVGSIAAPYINSLISDPYTAFFTQSFAITHPSQPNYLQLFSGSTQGVTDDNVPAVLPFVTANLGAELLAATRTFIGYSEDLPSVGYTGATSGNYARKHNPWVNWQGTSTNGIPSASNQPFTSFPTDYTSLPTVSYVIPNQVNDMHNGTDTARIGTCDRWMKKNLDGYIQWAKSHNSLFILTFDEDDNSSSQHIVTFFTGHMVQHGNYSTSINHYNLLRVVEDMYGLSHAGAAGSAATIGYCWNSCYLSIPTVTPSGNVSICSGSSQTLTSSAGNTYVWSTGATTRSISVSTAGTFSVTVSQSNGCTQTSLPVTTTVATAQPTTQLFTESMGSVGSTTTLISTHEANNGFDNDNYTMTGSADIRTNPSSTGYGTGLPTASGLSNVFITNTVGKNFVISGINTVGLSNLQLSFGIFKSTTTGTGSDLLVKVSDNGGAYSTLSYPALPTGSGTAVWTYRTASGTIPASTNLSIQFIQNGTATQYRIDDVRLLYSAVPVITAGGPTTFCTGDSVQLTSSAGSSYLWSSGATTSSIIARTSGNYTVTINCTSSTPVTVTVNSCPVTLNLKVFFEGFYVASGDSMQAVVNPGLYPLLFDTVTVELHDTIAPFNTTVAHTVRRAVNTHGSGAFVFPSDVYNKKYYIVIRHRNSLETWSKTAVLFNSYTMSFDFTSP